MPNQIPFSGATDAAGGYLLPEDQGDLLTLGLLRETGTLSLAGDSRATGSRRTTFSIWQGAPTAEFVPEGGTKPVTGGEFGPGTLNIKKLASIVLFTDEMIEDVQGGDLNVLVDGGVREAISDTIDANALGLDSGVDITGNFDVELVGTTQSVAMGTSGDAFALAVSAAMGSLENNGYSDIAVLTPADFPRHLRDARSGGTLEGLYQQIDPLYGKPNAVSTNLDTLAAGGTVGIAVSRPNLHVRVRKDVTVARSTEATVGGTSLWQTDQTGVRYVTRLGFWVHDLNRAVVKITK